MEDVRPIKELLILVRKVIRQDKDPDEPKEMLYCRGICNAISTLYDSRKINFKEKTILDYYLDSNIPKSHPRRIKGWLYDSYGAFWWKPFLRIPRLQWLTKQINKL